MSGTASVDAAAESFGPYRIEELLGRGGMGEVHRAYDTVHERYVALKRLPRLAGAEFESRFRREARIVEGLRGPHIVPVHAHGEIDGRLYLDMRLVDGPDLKRLLADGPLDPARAVAILTQVASAIDAAHASGVLHRDVKPANILLDADGTAYLADFGIAWPYAPDVTHITRTGDQVGTLDYMAPERLLRNDFRDVEVDAASDVYSLACVLYQCLTGRVPFPAPDAVGKLAAQLGDPPPVASLFDRRIPPALDLVIATGMDKDPRRRYPNAGELMAAAEAAVAQAPPSVPASITVGSVTTDPGQTHFVRLLITVGAQPTAPPPEALADTVIVRDVCPYPGLQSFGTDDSRWFFGRAQAVRDLLARLARTGADDGPLMIVGASGAGKSSLVHAGLLAAHVRADAAAPRLAMTPGEHPLTTLAARLAPLTRTDPRWLAQQLWTRPSVLGDVCRAATPDSSTPMIIAIDQAEELFTQCRDAAEREAFTTALAHAWPARVVFAVRADFVDRCLGLTALTHALRAPFLLGPLDAADLAEVITGPAAAARLEVEPGLVDRLITDVGAGADPGALPRLAHALRETWRNRDGNRLTLTGYQRAGGVDRAVALTAEGVHARLSAADRVALRAALLRMVTLLDGGGIARRRAARAEIPGHIIESLVSARLVTVDHEHVQLAHDALLTAWPRLREWVAEDRAGLLLRQQLGQAVAGWLAGGRDRADLYRGARLLAAVEWSAGRTDLTPDERAFLAASDRERRKRTRRLGGLVAGLAALLVVALVAGVVALVARADAERQRRDAQSRQLAAESLAEAEVDPVDAMRKAVQAWRISPTVEARGALLSAPLLTYPATFAAGVTDASTVDVNADGSMLVVGSTGGSVKVWDLVAHKALDLPDLAAAAGGGTVVATRFSPDGRLLATSSLGENAAGSGVRIWSIPDGREVSRPHDTLPVIGPIAWRADGRALAGITIRGDATPAVGEWDPFTGKLLRWVATTEADVTSMAYDPSGTRLALGRGDGSVELWDTASAKLVSRRTEHAAAVSASGGPVPVQVAFSGDLLASSTVVDHLIRLWDPRTGKPVRSFPDVTRHSTEEAPGPSAIAFSADGSTLYSNSDLDSMTMWDPDTGRLVGNLKEAPRAGTASGRAVIAIAASRDGRTRVALASDGTVSRWHTNKSWYVAPDGSVLSVAFHPDGRTIAAGDANGGLYTWDTTNGDLTGRTDGDRGVNAIHYTPDGTRIVGTGDAKFTSTSPVVGPATPREVDLAGQAFHGSMAVSPDGRWVAAAVQNAATPSTTDSVIHVWDTRTMAEHAKLDLGDLEPAELAFSPHGDRLLALVSASGTGLASGGNRGSTAITWRTTDFGGEQRVPLGADSLITAAFTPDGRDLVTAGTTGAIQLRDPSTGQVRTQFGSHPSTVRELAVSPDGRLVATVTTDDADIRLWDLADPSHPLVAVLQGHLAAPNRLAFSLDGRRLISGGTDTDVAVWHLDPADAVREVCANLTDARADGCG